MKISINQSELTAALNVVSKGASTRSTLPILSGILLKAYDNTLTLESTNLDLSIRSACPAFVEEEGETVVPSKLLLEVVKHLPNAAVMMETDIDALKIMCESSSFSLRTLMAEDFPGFPEVTPDTSVTVPFELFADMAKKVSKVVSHDESRAILTGVLIEVDSDLLRLVATDSYRLAFTETKLEEEVAGFKAVVAGAFLNNVAGMAAETETLVFGVSENQIIIRIGSTTFVNRRIEGNFPRYGQLLPDNYKTRATCETRALIDAVKRVSLLNDKTNPVKFDMNAASQTTQLSTSSQDIGAASETISSTVEGDDLVIGFNPSYVLDALNSVSDDNILVEFDSAFRPGVFKNPSYYQPAEIGGERFACAVMPVRLA